ncbi:MAG: hypothetical protein ACK4F7_06795 [Inhella sp.]
MRPALLIASPDAERRRRARALLVDWPCYEATDPASLLRLLAAARPALLLLDADWPAGGAERAGLLELRLDEPLLDLRARVAALLAAPPPALQ